MQFSRNEIIGKVRSLERSFTLPSIDVRIEASRHRSSCLPFADGAGWHLQTADPGDSARLIDELTLLAVALK